MSQLNKVSFEYSVKASPKLIFTLIGSAEGLARWFAERVQVKDNIYTFEWEGSMQTAKLKEFKEGEFISFEWLDEHLEGSVMELRISHEPVSGESALIVSEYAETLDMEITELWWNQQVSKLQRMFSN